MARPQVQVGDFAKIVRIDKYDPFFKYEKQIINEATIRVNHLDHDQKDGPYPIVSGIVVLRDIPLNGDILEKGGHICLKALLRKVEPSNLP